MRRFIILAALFLLLLNSCSRELIKSESKQEENTSSQGEVAPTELSRKDAIIRFKQISHIRYVLWFGLDPVKPEYDGRAVISFELKPRAREHGKDLRVDFEGGSIKSISINETLVPPGATETPYKDRFDGHRIRFGINELQTGTNRIEIAFSHPYSQDGEGFYRSKDPVDGNVYLYSNFEPYGAHTMFPCFDQPDLKGTFELSVRAPQDWQVISNTLERDVTQIEGKKTWAFPITPILATYVFALHAGPYSVWKADADGIPLRLFARRSLAQYVDYDEWFEITRKGISFYVSEFGYPLPYAKYDQIIVPDFNSGAMESAAAVTFNERMIYRTRVTAAKRRRRTNVILHEMAHMWFGDLVTMKWWNGLWLNESFADFMSHLAEADGLKESLSWQDFSGGTKDWAYAEDERVTTHPIEGSVPDTNVAKTEFDGITYGKGAAVLKQLRYYLGNDDFREGVQRYFAKYPLRNTTIHEFFKMLSEASNKDLTAWQHSWLQTAGLNAVTADWTCSPDSEGQTKISKFVLNQSGTPLRSHKTEIALFRKNTKDRLQKEVIPFVYLSGENPVAPAIGKACPDFVFPNDQDYDYVKVKLDPTSLKFVSQHLSEFEEPTLRQALWLRLWQMVRDSELSAQDYAEIGFKNLENEKSAEILARILGTWVDTAPTSPSVALFLPVENRTRFLSQVEEVSKKMMTQSRGSDRQLVWYQTFLEAANSPGSLEFCRKLLANQAHVSGIPIDQERRWELIHVLARNGVDGAQALIDSELKKDATDKGQESAIAAEVSFPDTAKKKIWMTRILRIHEDTLALPSPTPSQTVAPAAIAGSVISQSDAKPEMPPSYSLAKLRIAMKNFNVLGQESLIESFADSYFDALPRLASAPGVEDQVHASRFAEYLFPALCSSKIARRTGALLDSYSELPSTIAKDLKILKQQEEKCIRARETIKSDFSK